MSRNRPLVLEKSPGLVLERERGWMLNLPGSRRLDAAYISAGNEQLGDATVAASETGAGAHGEAAAQRETEI